MICHATLVLLQALLWALRDKYDSYTAAPMLAQALNGYPRRVNDSAGDEGDEALYAGRSLSTMNLLEILNEFREVNGMPILS